MLLMNYVRYAGATNVGIVTRETLEAVSPGQALKYISEITPEVRALYEFTDSVAP